MIYHGFSLWACVVSRIDSNDSSSTKVKKVFPLGTLISDEVRLINGGPKGGTGVEGSTTGG